MFAIDVAVQTLPPGVAIDVALPNGLDPYLIPIPHPRLEVTLPNAEGARRMITLTTVAGRLDIN